MKKHTPLEWAEFFGFEFVDTDGWDGWESNASFNIPIRIEEFITRTCRSCIAPVDDEKFKLFNFFC